MANKIIAAWVQRHFGSEEALVLLLALLLSAAVIFFWGDILTPVFASALLAFLLQGGIERLVQLRCPKPVAFGIVYLFFLGLLLAMLLVVLPRIVRQCVSLFAELPTWVQALKNGLNILPERYPALFNSSILDQLFEVAASEAGRVGKQLVSVSFASISSVMQMMVYLVLVPVLTFLFLLERERISSGFHLLLRNRSSLLRIATDMDKQVSSYLRGKAVEILVVGVVSFVCFFAFGLKYAALLAFGVGLSVLIPFVGAALVTVPVVLVGYLQWGLDAKFLWLCAAYAFIQFLDAYVLVPWLFSEAMNLSPLLILVAVLVFGGLWGVWGVVFAIPLAVLIKTVFSMWPSQSEPT